MLIAVGCIEFFPKGISQFSSCAYGAALSVKSGEERVDVDCAIPDGWELVGIPAGNVQANELVAVGLAAEIAEMLVRGDDDDARWCVTRSVPYDSSRGGKQTTAESSCTDSDIVIEVPVHSTASKVTLTVQRSNDGQPVLAGVKPIE